MQRLLQVPHQRTVLHQQGGRQGMGEERTSPLGLPQLSAVIARQELKQAIWREVQTTEVERIELRREA